MHFRSRARAAFIGLVLVSACASYEPVLPLHDQAMQAVETAEPKLVAFRHDLHRHPELAGNEKRTSGKVAEALLALGYEVRTSVGGYGVTAILEGRGDGPLIAFRSDMDAVAGEAADPVAYASVVDGAHHICGHDVHTTIGIGLAEAFAAIKDRLDGDVMLIFQPAEEAGTGAQAMLADGVFETREPAAIFAVHTVPLPVGQLSAMPDGMMAGRMLITATVSGTGNTEAAALALRAALEAAGDVPPQEMFIPRSEPFIFMNLFPETRIENDAAVVRGFVMSAGIDDRPRVQDKLRAAAALVATDGVDITVAFEQALEGVNNNPDLLALASGGIAMRADDVSVLPLNGVTPAFSEDFGSFQKYVPGVMYFLGVNNPEKGTIGFPHSPDYVADDASILVGTEAMLAAMLEAMEAGAQ